MKPSDEDRLLERRGSALVPHIRLLRLKDVLKICGKSRSSIYEAIRRGEFPKPIKLGANTSAWIDSEIDEWIRHRIETSRAE